jgi:hypothetical protein
MTKINEDELIQFVFVYFLFIYNKCVINHLQPKEEKNHGNHY